MTPSLQERRGSFSAMMMTTSGTPPAIIDRFRDTQQQNTDARRHIRGEFDRKAVMWFHLT
jgi:hypothetical protein